MTPIDFGGQRSKVKVTMDIYGNKLVNMIETKWLCASSSNLADTLTVVRGWTLLILEVRECQGHDRHHCQCGVCRDATFCVVWLI